MKVLTYAKADAAAWDACCDSSAEAWLFHRRAWIDVEARRFTRENHSFAIGSVRGIAAVCPLYLSDGHTGTGGERLLHSGIHRQAGVAACDGIAKNDLKSARRAAMAHILELAEQLDVDRIQLSSHNLAPRNLGLQREEIPFWVEDYGFEPGVALYSGGVLAAPGMSTCNADQIVDLDAEEDELFARLEESCRRAVRKGESNALRLSEAMAEADVFEYYRIAKLSASRTGESLAPPDYYLDLWRAFAAERRCVFLFVGHGQRRVAALVLLVDKGASSFLAGVSDPEYLPMRVNDFMHWSAIRWAKQRGLRYYRLGPSFPTVDPEWPIAKVSRFKTKFGGRPRTIIHGSFFRRPEKYRESALTIVNALCVPRSASTKSS